MSETPHQDDPQRGVTEEEIERAMAVDSLPEPVERATQGDLGDQVQLSDGSLVDEQELEGDAGTEPATDD